MNDNKRLIIILLIWTVIFTIIGATLAKWNWQTANNKKTNVTFTVNRDYTCGADAGGNITSSDVRLAPAKCNDPVYAIKRPITTSVTTTGDKVVSMDLWLNINNISTNLTNTPNFKWAITKNGNTCNGAIKQGNFTNVQNNKIALLDGVEYSTLDDNYYLYIWLDEAETSSSSMNGSFNFSIGGICQDYGRKKTQIASIDFINARDPISNAGINAKTQISDIYYIYDDDLPSGIKNDNDGEFDFSTDINKPITGYLIENTDPGAAADTYKLYISSEYRIDAGTSYANYYRGMTALKNIVFDNFDTSRVVDMHWMFMSCSSLISLNLRNFNTSSVTQMYGMFQSCTNLQSVNLSSFDTSHVVSMYQMFLGCSSLTDLDVSGFNTSSVTGMTSMFNSCRNLTTLDLRYFDTSNVTNMREMFSGCNSLSSLNLSNFNTSSVNGDAMTSMFAGCSSLTSLDLSSFNTSSVTNMGSMFSNCSNLERIYVSSLWNTSAVTTSANMFNNASKLPNYNSSVTDKTNAHYGEGGYLTYKAYTPPSSGS